MVYASQVAIATTTLTTAFVQQATRNRPTLAKTIVFRTLASSISRARPIPTVCLARCATMRSTIVLATLAFERVHGVGPVLFEGTCKQRIRNNSIYKKLAN